MGRPWRLWAPWPAAAQSPRYRFSSAGDRAVGRIEIRFLDFQRTVQAARACQLFFGGRQRNRLGEADLPRLGFAEIYLVEEILKTRLFRRAGSPAAAVRLHRRIPAWIADPIRQARIRMQFAQAFQRSGTTADRQIRAVVEGRAFRRTVRALPAAIAYSAFEIFVPHPRRRQGLVPAEPRGPSGQNR